MLIYKEPISQTHKELMKEWDYEKNIELGLDPEKLTQGSGRKVWWKCRDNNDHIWMAVVNNRIRHNSGCPYCAGRLASKENCLFIINPILSSEWNFTKNEILTPNDVTVGSNKKVWWRCGSGHEWKSNITSRNKGNGCPYCDGKKVNEENCLAINFPDLVKEWHFIKNSNLTPYNVVPGSDKKVWWVCKNGHEWQSNICNRKNGSRCPVCSIENRSGENHPNYNPNLTDEDRENRRNNKKIPFWRKKVYARDKYSCQICGDNKGGNLNAHHLMGYNKYSKLRYNEDNGVTLCDICHMDFHKIYGRGDNTKAQFNEYKKSCRLYIR